ncbi:MAG: c-type cytochrome [Bosea sp. (in: a-proteobacteria)]
MGDFRDIAVFLAASFAVLLAVFPGTPSAIASPELARSRNCVACHHLERKMNGPAYQAIAAKYANDEAAAKMLGDKIIKGGGGNWGQMAMPAQPNVTQPEADALVSWILSQK